MLKSYQRAIEFYLLAVCVYDERLWKQLTVVNYSKDCGKNKETEVFELKYLYYSQQPTVMYKRKKSLWTIFTPPGFVYSKRTEIDTKKYGE